MMGNLISKYQFTIFVFLSNTSKSVKTAHVILLHFLNFFLMLRCFGNDYCNQKKKIHASCVVSAMLFIYGLESFVLW